MADLRRSITMQYDPDQLAGIPLGSSFGQLESGLCQVSTGAVRLVDEPVDDGNFSARGWYDGDFVFDPTESFDGGAGSIKAEWVNPGDGTTTGGGGMRRLFSPSETVYLRYYRKSSSSYIGSSRLFHPHEWQFLVEQDDAFIGPSETHTTVSLESIYQNGEIPRLGITDALNIDNNQIGVDLVGVTELRGVNGCNGLTGDLPDNNPPACFILNDPNHFAAREYDAAGVIVDPNDKTLWHKWEWYVQLNSVQAGVGQTDGIVQCWVDDVLVIDQQNMIIRTGQWPSMRFNQVLLKPFIGSGGAPVSQTLWYDGIVVETARPGGTPPVDPPDPPVDPPPNPGGDHPNEPGGYAAFFQNDFKSPLAGGYFNCNGANEIGASYSSGSGVGVQLYNDSSTPPTSDKSVSRFTFNQGLTPGDSPELMFAWSNCSESNGDSYDEVYESFFVKLDGPGNLFSSHGALTKAFGYFGFGGKGQGQTPTEGYFGISGNGSTLPRSPFSIFMTLQYGPGSGPPTSNRGQNVDSGWRMDVGHWYQFEKVVTINSSPDAADGTVKVWMRRADEVTPTLLMDYNDIIWAYSEAGYTSGFYGRYWNPVWGGVGGPNLGQTQFIWCDQWYMSGIAT